MIIEEPGVVENMLHGGMHLFEPKTTKEPFDLVQAKLFGEGRCKGLEPERRYRRSLGGGLVPKVRKEKPSGTVVKLFIKQRRTL